MKKNYPIKVRFAPSPTGYLHIGGARTALFNYLFAKHNHGKFYVRIEDTDKERSTKIYKDSLLHALNWLSLTPDIDYIYQSTRYYLYENTIQLLLEHDYAYYDYSNYEQLQKIQDPQKRILEIRQWRDKKNIKHKNAPIRFKSPMEGSTTIHDLVQGNITIQNAQLDDFILWRSDQSPTYMLAAVVDDIDMEISHIIRGDDHLNNAFRQFHLFEALLNLQKVSKTASENEYLRKIPEFAHIPLIHNNSGQKLSKRDGNMNVIDYKSQGYLPEALINYCLLLGFSYNNQDYIPLQKAIEVFNLEKVGKSPSKWNEKKMQSLNELYIRKASPVAISQYIQTIPSQHPIIQTALEKNSTHHSILLKSIEFFQHHAKTLLDIEKHLLYMLHPPSLSLDILHNEEKETLLTFVPIIESLTKEQWNDDILQQYIKNFITQYHLSFKDIGMPLRLSITGEKHTPSITKIMEILGKETTLKRINDALKN